MQLGRQVQRLAAEKGFSAGDALAEVAEATKDALRGGRALSKNELHEELRARVGADLMPWCKGCKSHHVAPMLWRYGGVKAGARLDSERRYLLGKPGRAPAAAGRAEPLPALLRTGRCRRLRRLGGRREVPRRAPLGTGRARPRRGVGRQAPGLGAERRPEGSRVAPGRGGRPVHPARRPLFADAQPPAPRPRSRASQAAVPARGQPGVVLARGRLAGLWRVKAKGKRTEITVEKLARLARKDIEEEAERIAVLRGGSGLLLVVD